MNLKEKFLDRKGFKREKTLNSMKSNKWLEAGDTILVAEDGFFYDVFYSGGSIELQNGLFASPNLKEYQRPGLCVVGGILILTTTQHPALTWPGTTWDKIEDRFLKGTTSEEVPKQLGGKNKVKLTINNIPQHNHILSVILEKAGIHRHIVDPHSHALFEHYHHIFANTTVWPNRDGDASNLTTPTTYTPVRNAGWFAGGIDAECYASQHLSTTIPATLGKTSTSSISQGGASPFTDEKGEHSHSIKATSENTGNGKEFDIQPEFYTVNFWLRLS